MISLFINYVTTMWKDPLVDLTTLAVISTLGMMPFICVCLFVIYSLKKIQNKTLIFFVSVFTAGYAVIYPYKLYDLLETGYTYDNLLVFFIYLSGSIAAILITIISAKKALKKTAYATKNGVTKECKTIEKGNKND